MKILISVLPSIFRGGGTATRAKRIIAILKDVSKITIVTRGDEQRDMVKVMGVNAIVIKPSITKLWNLKLIPVIMKNKFDLVYCLNDWFGFITYYLLSKIYKYKIIFDAHDVLSERPKARLCPKIKLRLYKSLEKFVIKHAEHVTALSRDIFEFYKKYNKNINLIPLFTDEEIFKKNEEMDNHKAKKFSKLIGLIGPFDGSHNMPQLEFLYSNLNRFDDRITFIIIGECTNKIKNERVIYTNYLASTQDYVNHLSCLDAVLVHQSLAHGPYSKILEPMSCSLPVFTLPKGIIGLEYVKHGKDILIFEDDNKLIDKINELIFDGDLTKKIGKNARITIEKYYSKKANKIKLVKLFLESSPRLRKDGEDAIYRYTSYTKYVHLDDLDFVIKSLRECFKHQVNFKGLDFGCGSGNMTIPLASLGYEMIGFDISQEKIIRAKSKSFSKDNPMFFVGDAENLGISKNEIFDFVICTEVLEHLKHPERALNSIGKVIKRGGILIVSVPNGYGPYSLIYDYFRNKIVYEILPKIGKSDHVQSFSLNGINRLLTKAGFNVVRAKNSDFLSFLPILGQSYWFCFYDRKLADKLPSIFASGYYLICKK